MEFIYDGKRLRRYLRNKGGGGDRTLDNVSGQEKNKVRGNCPSGQRAPPPDELIK